MKSKHHYFLQKLLNFFIPTVGKKTFAAKKIIGIKHLSWLELLEDGHHYNQLAVRLLVSADWIIPDVVAGWTMFNKYIEDINILYSYYVKHIDQYNSFSSSDSQ